MEGNVNEPMAGVGATPLKDKGTCRCRADGSKCLSPDAPANLWRVRWGDGVEMDLCTRCMASLVFEE